MFIKDLLEASPLTFKGSISPDLLISKLWICNQLKDLNQTNFSTIYVLGSWYGNMSIILTHCGISFEKIVNVDINKDYLEISEKLLSALNIPFQNMNKDVNKLNYQQIDSNSLIINTSISEIEGIKWFESIPKNTLVILQSRNNSEIKSHQNLESFDRNFPLSNTLFLDEIELSDSETPYKRFMKIGVK